VQGENLMRHSYDDEDDFTDDEYEPQEQDTEPPRSLRRLPGAEVVVYKDYHVIALMPEEAPKFQSELYRLFSPITVKKEQVHDDIEHRSYFGRCRNCDEEHYLGTIILRCDEVEMIYARV
jgi:hypothetical protein